MLKRIYAASIFYPKATIAIIAIVTIVLASQLTKLRWETDARVYLPKGHPAIIYDEKVDDIFGVKDNIIIGIENNQEGVFNVETLARIARITDKVAALPGVQAINNVDISSLSTATLFVGSETEIGTKLLMEKVPSTPEEVEALKKLVYDNPELYVGNIVSADGKAAMIRAKIKEGMQHRYETYFGVKTIIAQETGDWSGMQQNWSGGNQSWNKNASSEQPAAVTSTAQAETSPTATEAVAESKDDWWKKQQMTAVSPDASTAPTTSSENAASPAAPAAAGASNPWWPGNTGDGSASTATDKKAVKDTFYLAGRPVIEVSSGLFALKDMVVMVPAIIGVMAFVLLLMFRSMRGVLLPLGALGIAIIWTLGLMAAVDVPMYTISTMLPVILVAVCIGYGVHIMSVYYDVTLANPHRPGAEIVRDVVRTLGTPLIMTSVTTGIGFLTFLFADMPPFRMFGVFSMIGIMFAWLVMITLLPAMLAILKPRVANYYEKRRAMRVYENQGRLSWMLSRAARLIDANKRVTIAVLGVLLLVTVAGSTQLFINSSWLSDFRKDSDVYKSTAMLNDKFSGTVFLNIVIEANEQDAFKDPQLLSKMEAMQAYLDKIEYVGDTLSVVDYLKSMNKSLHSADPNYLKIPSTREEIAEYLFLFSVSGRPEQLNQVVDLDYKTGLISVTIKTDYTRPLKHIIDEVNQYVAREFTGVDVKINLSGSANNSFIWADLLIGSQASSIIFSKVAIFIVASLVMMSIIFGVFVVVPITLSTVFVAGVAGLLKIPLDVSTALAAGIAIGVGVDYAIHYVYRYKIEREQKDHIAATVETMRTTGRTIVLNAIVVIAGFGVLFLSEFPPHIKLGYFVAAYMVVSCIVTLVAMPVLTSYYKPKRIGATT